jgi:hypothetical protein
MTRSRTCPALWLGGATLFLALGAAQAQDPARAPGADGCWVRGDRGRLSLRASPLDSVTGHLARAEIKVCYSRPSARGRPVMGALVPFGQPWRLGANEATTLRLSIAVRFGDLRLLPGTYSLYAVPGPEMWELVVNAEPERWGIPIGAPVQAHDLGRAAVPSRRIETPVERLTLRFEPAGPAALTLVIEWEQTQLRVPIRPE